MNTKKRKLFLGILCFLTVFIASGCAIGEKREIRKTVKAELNQLKNSEPQTIANYINNQDLLPDFLESDAIFQDIADVFALYYDNFSFRIKEITVDKKRATVRTKIKNLDAEALAKDFTAKALQQHIEHSADLEDTAISINDYYLLLKDLLQTNKYDTKTEIIDITLKKKGDTWQVVHSPELDNLLTGKFFSYVTDPNLLSPSEIVEIHFDTIKNFGSEQLKRYFRLDEVLEGNDAYNNEIADALAEQICLFFDYEITGETIKNGQAVVQASITSADIQSIVDSYQSELNPWLKTSDALASGSDGRYKKIQKMMLSCIKDNESSASSDIDIPLVNDGVNWKIQMTSEIAHAFFGDIQYAISSIADTVQ